MPEPAAAPGVTRWWGWGDPEREVTLGPEGRALLRSEIGEAEPGGRVELEEVAMPTARPLPAEVREAAGVEALLDGHEHRVRRASGCSYPDLVRLRAGRLERAPDGVLLPASADHVAAILAACRRTRTAVVPFGGGTSVVGGVDPLPLAGGPVIALDLRRLRAVEVDRRSLIATLGPGLRGPEAEAALAAEGLTLGHFPQSFEQATIGGYAATRSAGQASSGYGRFDEIVTRVALAAPAGGLVTRETPHSAAGPALRELVVGSEGTLGVITRVSARVRPLPEARRYEGWFAPGFAAGAEAIRGLGQAHALPDVVRLSDEAETRVSLGTAGGATAGRALRAYLRLRGVAGGCLVVCGWEGERRDLERRRSVSARLLRRAGLVGLGAAPGRAWLRGRYDGPYLRDALLDLGYMVETLETAHTWRRLEELYRGVGEAIAGAMREGGRPGLVMCHLSHAYPDGASLYFTFIAPRRPGEEIEQWREVKRAASEAIVAAEGTITHHHAVGRDHAPYMRAEVTDLGLEALRALKARLDPEGIMNPGKLLPGRAPSGD